MRPSLLLVGIPILALRSADLLPPRAHLVDVIADNYYLKAPDTLPAGLTTLRLQVRDGMHMAILVRLDSGHTAADLLRARPEGHPRPSWMHFIGGPGFPPPNGSDNATMILVPGNYLLLCDVRDRDGAWHVEKGMFHPIVVRAKRTLSRAALPRPDAVVEMRDYRFVFWKPIHAGNRTLRVVNDGSVLHEFRLVHVLPGHTGQESMNWKPSDGTPRPDEDIAALVAIPPGGELTTSIAFKKGEYVVFCVPEIAHGMMQLLRVDVGS